MEALQKRLGALVEGGLCVAFSGGVDSSVILKLACVEGALRGERVYAVTFDTKLHPSADLSVARQVAEDVGAIHHVIHVNELNDVDILNNPVDRCYRCKKYLFETLVEFAKEKGIKNIVDGTNFEDLSAYRPGIQALRELNIISPLAELGITKAQVRSYGAQLGLSVSDRPSAPCLATRLPYDTPIDFALLQRIDEGECYLKSLGFSVNRIRVHGDIARIEIPKDRFSDFLKWQTEVIHTMKSLGFVYITLDLEGFRSGSMDVYVRGETWT